MKELYRTNNELVVYEQLSGGIAIYENGNYYYQSGYDKTIEDMEKHNFVKFNLTEEERQHINYLMVYVNRNDFIEEVYNFYDWNFDDDIAIKKDVFNEYELEVLLYNDFKDFNCYEDETNDKYIIIEKKEVLKNERII